MWDDGDNQDIPPVTGHGPGNYTDIKTKALHHSDADQTYLLLIITVCF